MQKSSFFLLVLFLCSLLGLSSFGDESKSDPSSSETHEGWIVLCGTVSNVTEALQIVNQISGIQGIKAEIVRTDDFDGLSPGLRVISAGFYQDKLYADVLVNMSTEEYSGMPKCYAKKVRSTKHKSFELDPKNLIFVGYHWEFSRRDDPRKLVFCRHPQKGDLPFSICAANLKEKTVVLEPNFHYCEAKAKDFRIFNKVTVDQILSSAVSAYGTYKGKTEKVRRPSGFVVDLKKKERKIINAELLKRMRKKTGWSIVNLYLETAVKADLDEDGVWETMIHARGGVEDKAYGAFHYFGIFEPDPAPGHWVDGYIVYTQADMKYWPTPWLGEVRSIPPNTPWAGHMGSFCPVGLFDVTGDDHVDIFLKWKTFSGGGGEKVYTYKNGKLTPLREYWSPPWD